MLHNSICPSPSDLAAGYAAMPRAEGAPSGAQQFDGPLPGGWCGPDSAAAAPGASNSSIGSGPDLAPVHASTGTAGQQCYSVAGRLVDWAAHLQDYGQVGGGRGTCMAWATFAGVCIENWELTKGQRRAEGSQRAGAVPACRPAAHPPARPSRPMRS